MVAALVRPTTAPRACRIVPAPMKPTPVTICAATRVGSEFPEAIVIDSLVYKTEPMQIRMFVRRPAGFPPSSRSSPMAPPNRVARLSWRNSSSRNISIICWTKCCIRPPLPRASPCSGVPAPTWRGRAPAPSPRPPAACRSPSRDPPATQARARGAERLRLGKGEAAAVREAGVPAARQLAHQLEVLQLVLADRHERGAIQQHVGRLEHRVVEQPGGDALLALCLVLELRLALELTERRHRVEQPVELAVLRDVRLHEHDRPLGVEADGEQPDRHFDGPLGEARHLVRLRDGVQIDDAEQAVVLLLQRNPVL